MEATQEKTYDVVAVDIETKNVDALFGDNNNEEDADAIVKLSVMARGCDEQFYAKVKHGKYRVGDTWIGN